VTQNSQLIGFTIYDPVCPSGQPDGSTPARQAAIRLENQIRHDSNETGCFIRDDGHLIIRKSGFPNQVQFSPKELANTDGTLFTHNHPKDGSFSVLDVKNAIQQKLTELRVVGPTLRYIMRPMQSWPSCRSVDTETNQVIHHITLDVHGYVRSGQLSSRFATLEIQHLIWERVSTKLGLKYIREKT